MFYGILIFIHVIVCIGLIGIVLIQAGRGGGLSETFSSAESISGTKTNAFLTRATSVFAVIFFITCLSLAFVSKQRSKSLLEGRKIPAQAQTPKPQEEAKPTAETKTTTQPSSGEPQPESSAVPAQAQESPGQ